MARAVHLRSAVALLGAYPALAGVDLEVDTGDIVLVRGANGAGKTSLLKVCAGLLPVVDGEAVVLGHDLRADRRPVRRQVGLLGHAGGLYDDLSVEDNVVFGVRAGGGTVASVGPALERLGLSGRLRRVSVSKLSAGQRRRVAIAALVARAPALWLLDEPHAGLDAEGRDLLDGLVREAAAAGATVVFASHESDRAGALAGRAVVMAGGQLRPAPAGESADGPGRGWGPRLGEEAGPAAPAGESADGPGRGWGPRLGEEAGVGAPAGESAQ